MQQQSTRMERPKNQKYFPPGPQKVIRTPIYILKREVFSPPPRSVREKGTTSKSPAKELVKLQEKQGKSSSLVVSKDTANTQDKPLGEVKPILGSDTLQKKELPVQEDKSDENVSSDNLDLEEMMEGIQESAASSTESTKSG